MFDTTYNPARKYAELDRQQAAQHAGTPPAQPPSLEVPPIAGPPASSPPMPTPTPAVAPVRPTPEVSPNLAAPSPRAPVPTPPQPMPSLAPAPPAVPAAPQAPSPMDTEMLRIQLELAKEREALRALQAERDQLAAAQESARKEMAEAANIRAQAEARKLLDPAAWGLQHLDEEELVKVLQPVVTQLTAEQDVTRKQLAEAQAKQAAMQEEWTRQLAQQQAAMQREQTNRALLDAVPDWRTLMQDPTFQAYVQQPIEPGAGITVWQLMEHHYQQGNAAYVANKVAAFRNASVAAPITQVAPAVAGTVPPVPTEPAPPAVSDEELASLRMGVRKGTINQATFAEALKKYHNKGMDTKPVLQ